jgi:hypothetical protein
MWGHSLYDLAHADTSMKQPWATLRALGLYKRDKNAPWGIDYISGGSMRLANEDNGFRPMDLEKWIQWGGFKFLPKSLEAQVDFNNDESNELLWYQYYSRTHTLCIEFMEKLCVASVIGYLSLFGVIIPLLRRRDRNLSSTRKDVPNSIWALMRIVLMIMIAHFSLKKLKKHVDETDWAADIKAQRRYASTVKYDQIAFADHEIDHVNSYSTFPTKYDVLVETRYASDQFEMYNDFINNHPGNRLFQELLQQHSFTFQQYPFFFQDASATYILEAIGNEHGRFLIQNPNGLWLWMTHDDSVEYIKQQLATNTNTGLTHTMRAIRSLWSSTKYGIQRDTVMSQKHSRKFLKSIEKRLHKSITKPIPKNLVEGQQNQENVELAMSTFSLPQYSSTARREPREVSVPSDLDSVEPTPGAWLSAGDGVEAWDGNGYWYYGTLQNVTAHGWYIVKFWEGTDESIDIYDIRPAQPYELGERLEVRVPSDDNHYYSGIITSRNRRRKTFAAHVFHLDTVIHNLTPFDFRRKGKAQKRRPETSSGY